MERQRERAFGTVEPGELAQRRGPARVSASRFGSRAGNDTVGKPLPGEKLFGVDADFDDCDHELYDLQEDPQELVNLAYDRGRRNELRTRFRALRTLEAQAYAPYS